MNKKGLFLSPAGISIIYMLASLLVIAGFRLVFPGQPAPLRNIFLPWALIQGLLDFIGLFPALAMSSLVIPFGIKNSSEEKFAGFSPRFLELLKGPIITAIGAVAVYGLLFLLVFPLAQNYQSNMRFDGQLFRLARERAEEHAAAEEWQDAEEFVSICERIWPNSPELAALKVKVSIAMDEFRIARSDALAEDIYHISQEEQGPAYSGIPGQRNPVSATEALEMADTALREERYYDAHWLGTLAGRLARPGSAETAEAARIASLAWNAVAALEPNSRELQTYSLYHLKRDGYEAMISEDWIRAYYIFRELSSLSPGDPDVANFLVLSERGTSELAFFTDEMEFPMGDVITGAIFSIPRMSLAGASAAIPAGASSSGRVVLRIASLSTAADASYGIGFELISFDSGGRLFSRAEAPYVKILPITLGGHSRVVVLMRALDRLDRERRWEPVWTGPEVPGRENAQIVLDTSYENFLLLSKARRKVESFFIGDLLSMGQSFGDYGYIPQVFQAEIMSRIAEPVVLLPLMILALIIGWRFRARQRPRYLWFPMLAVLPLVFSGIIRYSRTLFNNLGIWLILSLGFSTALLVFFAGILLFFILSLILLAAQHG
ncbi:MAG: hypothetical protein LBP93_06790 [Treponema sp.]|jgi:hypothetical protein|nr:hypothetical protein [Treponema sp.]